MSHFPPMLWRVFFLLGLSGSVLGQGSLGGDQSNCTAYPFTDLGCYADSDNGAHAAFTFTISSNPNSPFYYPGFQGPITPRTCQTACRGHGFEYAGAYKGTICYCASTFPNPSAGDTTQDGPGPYLGSNPPVTTSSSKCQAACSGDSSQVCGGSAAIEVYQDPSFRNAPTAGMAQNYGYIGCFTYTPPGPLYVTLETNSTASCASYCGQLGYPYMGRSGFDSQSNQLTCGCGSEVQTGNQVDDSYCNYFCSGPTNAVYVLCPRR
jgi:WSC domain